MSIRVLTRPTRSPMTPKAMPPTAHPTRKTAVAYPAASPMSASWMAFTTCWSAGAGRPSSAAWSDSFALNSGNRLSSVVAFGTRSVIAGRRARVNNCWSRQSMSQARQQTMNTNHW